MGQRLVVEIKKDDNPVANAYYHWSAYTDSSLEVLKQTLENYNELKESCVNENGEIDAVLVAVKMLENTGAGLTQNEMEEMKKLYPNIDFKKAVDRNEGLISITEAEMEDSRGWSEGIIFIDLDSEMISFYVISELSCCDEDTLYSLSELIDRDPDDIIEEASAEEIEDIIQNAFEKVPDISDNIKCSLEEIPFDMAAEVADIIMAIDSYVFKLHGTVYDKIA